MVMTKRGVYHNLKESEYAISNGEVAFFFSSMFYLDKFMDEFSEHRIAFRERLSRTVVVKGMNTDTLADIHLYRSIEKRGFRSTIKEGEVTWQELHRFAFLKMTDRNTQDWSEMPVQK